MEEGWQRRRFTYRMAIISEDVRRNWPQAA